MTEKHEPGYIAPNVAQLRGDASFRSGEEWKAALMALPDVNFFELLRSVFGNIKTPFSKQKLMEDLFNLLSRNEVKKTIAAYIDERDHKIIAAIALLNEPAPGDLESFFTGEFSFAEIQSLLRNLEERLIIYRVRGKGGDGPRGSDAQGSGRSSNSEKGILFLALNPVLKEALTPFITDNRILFPVIHPTDAEKAYQDEHKAESAKPASRHGAKKGNALDMKANDLILAALNVFLRDQEEPLKTEGVLKKKVLDEGNKLFPALDLNCAVRTFLKLGLFRNDDSGLFPEDDKIAEFCTLSPTERQVYWVAGVYLGLKETENTAENAPPFFSRNRPYETASFIHRYMLLLESGQVYPELTLRRLMELLVREETRGLALLPRLSDNTISFDPLLSVLEKTGFCERVKNGDKKDSIWKITGVDETSTGEAPDGDGKPVIVMDAAFSFILYPEISFTDAVSLGAFCSVKPFAENSALSEGKTLVFELSRKSAVRGFDQGIGSSAMIDILGRLSHNRTGENLEWTLRDWEKRYAGVSLYHGVILTLEEDRRYLAEAQPVASLILRTLAPGVYLLSPEHQSEAAAALRKAGVDIIAQPPPALPAAGGFNTGRKLPGAAFRQISFRHFSVPNPAAREKQRDNTGVKHNAGEPENAAGSIDSIKQQFYQVLDRMRLGKQEREELAARIERRLVLFDGQLEKASIRYERLEARGLDYQGKLAVAKDAVSGKSLVEVTWTDSDGEVKRIFGVPRSLEKKESENILSIDITDPSKTELVDSGNAVGNLGGIHISGNTFSISVGKISLLRRIKQSIFSD